MCSLLNLLSLLLLSFVVVWSNDSAFGNVATTTSSKDYVNFRLKETRGSLLDVLYNEQLYSTDDDHWNDDEAEKWKNLWSRTSGRPASQPRAVNLFDEMFIIDEQQQVLEPVALNLAEAAINNTQLNLASPNQPIKFVKSYFWNGLSFLIVCQMSYCTHYQGLNISAFKSQQQVIKYPGFIPIDAAFFAHADKPYLIIAYDLDHYFPNGITPSSKVYEWNGSRMVNVDDIAVDSPKSVITFQDGQSTILLFTVERNAASADATRDSACVIYEMNDKSLIHRIKSTAIMAAAAVASIYPYNYANQQFFLTVNRMGLAEILRWNGLTLEKLTNLSNIQQLPDQIHILQVDSEALLFLSDLNALRIYKIDNTKVTHLIDFPLLNEQRVVQITAWKYENAIMLLLVKTNSDGTFQTELWKLNRTLAEQSGDNEDYAQVWDCFRELNDLLDSREATLKNVQIAQSVDLLNSNSSNQTFPLHLTNLIVNDGNVSAVEFRKQNNTMTFASPEQVKEKLFELKENVSVLKNNMMKNGANLSGNVSVASEAYFEELHIDNLEADYVNSERADFDNYLISGIDQQFSMGLNVKNVNVDDLSVSSLCGYGFDHWMQVNDSVRSHIANLKNINSSSIINDTIVIESELIMTDLNTRNINGIDLNNFLENVFIIGKKQAIRGDVRYEGIVQVARLYSAIVNNVSSSDLITKPSNQSLNDVFIDTLEVEELYVEKINGVAIDKAARMSGENLIKGKVTLTKLIITDELTVKENIAIPLTHSTQVYDQIYIDGDVFIKNLELEDHSSLNIGSELLERASIRSLVKNSWSKSASQIIEAPVIRFERGAAIDQLDCPYLNGLGEHDFLYTDSHRLDDLENVTFANFHLNNAIGSGPPASFLEETNDYLTFRRSVRMKYLSVDNALIDKYNGIPIESIMQSNDLLQFPDDFQFDTVRVDAAMSAHEVRVNRLNLKSSEALAKALRTDQHVTLHSLAADRATFRHLNVSRLNGRDLEGALAAQRSLLMNRTSGSMSVTIDAQVTIEADVQVDRINNEEASDYISRLRDADPTGLTDIESLADLTIAENLEVGLLNGQTVDQFFAASLSRAKQQTLNGRVTFIDAEINYLTADAINSIELSQFIYFDRPPVFYGNVSFFNLHLDGHVKSQTFNGGNASELERRLHRLPMTSTENLLVQGDVQWDKPSSHLRSLAHLLDNAVTRHEDQLIDSPITFEKPVVVESLYLSRDSSDVSAKIAEIISDTVIDSIESNPTAVSGTKIFKQALIVSNLEVNGNIDIKHINGLDIHQISSQVFQKDKAEAITADITFLNNVEIARLLTTNNIHGVALQQLAVIGQKMPKKLHFQHLLVDGNVSLDKLDGLDFDDFIKRRVTVDEDNEIFVDAEFVNSVRVLNASFVASVNEIVPEDLVQSHADGIPTMIHGNKIFHSKLIVEQNLETLLINDHEVKSIYDNAVLNGTEVNILGSLVFEDGVEISGNVLVSGEINGLKPQHSSQIKYLQTQLAQNTLNKGTSLLISSLNETEKGRRAFEATVMYLEEETKLNWHFAGVQSIKSLPVKHKTRLEIVTAETHELCDLQSNCSCRKQYVVDVLPSGEYEIQEQNANNVTYSFYPPEETYGLKIISESASYSEQCSKTADEHEYSKIFWLKFDQDHELLRRTPAVLINGYVSDAQIFQVGDQLYLIIAIFYNKETKTHATDSLVYQFDLINGKTFLLQRIPTNGAKSINVFQIPNAGIHVIIGCVKGKAESLLLRLNPITRQFQIIRTFATGGSKHVASISSNGKSFIILNNPDVRALQIFTYDDNSGNFVDYQMLFFEAKVTSLGVFYSGDFGHSDAFVVTTTKDGWLYIYEYMFYGKFQLKISHWADNIQVVTPFRHMSKNYLFTGFKFNSTVYKVIQQGYY